MSAGYVVCSGASGGRPIEHADTIETAARIMFALEHADCEATGGNISTMFYVLNDDGSRISDEDANTIDRLEGEMA